MWNNVRQLNLAANALHALLVLVLLAAGGYWLIQRPNFALREIQIDGDTEHINSPTVRAGVVGRLKGNFFTVDLDVARQAFEQMPWVRHASVRRVWPNALAVTLEEYKPLGTWGSDQLVSVDGELFTANQGELDDDLPAFDGPDGTAKEVVAGRGDATLGKGYRVCGLALSERFRDSRGRDALYHRTRQGQEVNGHHTQ
jgi:cell division protein FtsQ